MQPRVAGMLEDGGKGVAEVLVVAVVVVPAVPKCCPWPRPGEVVHERQVTSCSRPELADHLHLGIHPIRRRGSQSRRSRGLLHHTSSRPRQALCTTVH